MKKTAQETTNTPEQQTPETPDTNETPTYTVIGQGTFGKPLAQFIARQAKNQKVATLDIDPEKDSQTPSKETREERLKSVSIRLIQQDPSIAILAITSGQQTTEGTMIVKNWLRGRENAPDSLKSQDMKIIVNINSVQAPVRNSLVSAIPDVIQNTPVAIVSLHPYHGAQNFANPETGREEKPKLWILTNITVFNPDNNEDKNKELMSEAYQSVYNMRTDMESVEILDLSDGHEINGEHLNGSEYHDYIAAYYQAVFHMVRLVPGMEESPWYRENFGHVMASRDLSLSIIKDNDWALIVIDRFKQLVGLNYGIDNVLKAVKTLMAEGEAHILPKHRQLKTANVKKLEALADKTADSSEQG